MASTSGSRSGVPAPGATRGSIARLTAIAVLSWMGLAACRSAEAQPRTAGALARHCSPDVARYEHVSCDESFIAPDLWIWDGHACTRLAGGNCMGCVGADCAAASRSQAACDAVHAHCPRR